MPDIRWTIPDNVLAAGLPGEVVLLQLDDKRYYRVNETGAAIWKSIERGLGRSAIIEGLLADFDVAEDAAAAELDRITAELESRGLIHRAAGDEGA